MLRVLGLAECQDNMIGDDMHRGISGGQKRRVTLGEMMLPPRAVKYMDAITNGLDASTALDIIRALRYLSDSLGITLVISLLQVKSSSSQVV